MSAADTSSLPWRFSEDPEQRARYQRLCDGAHADGPRGRIVLCVHTTDLDERRGDLHVAAGLGLALVELGFGVTLVPRQAWHRMPAADVVVAMLPDVDPSTAPPGAWRVAWVRNETERWAALPHLGAYDQVVASSDLALTRLRRATPRASGVLPIGVDPQLFVPAADGGVRVRTAVTATHLWGTTPGALQALAALPDDADVRMYGELRGTPPDGILRWRRPALSYFALPDLYRRATLVIDDTSAADVGFGSMSSRFFESAAAGALPVVNGLLGVRELGLPDVPHYATGADLADVLARLRADGPAVDAMARELQARVRSEHSWERRAEQFVELVVGAAERGASEAPTRALHYYPAYHDNPFQAMLYDDLADADGYRVPVRDLVAHLRTRADGTEDPGVVHLHWTAPILQWTEGPLSAKRELDRFQEALEAFLDRGGRLVWTVHNLLPHDGRHRWAESRIGELLAGRASLIHVLSEDTLDAARDHFDLDPERTVVIAHSSYLGQYPTWVSPAAARRRLGIHPSEKVIVAVGGIRPYKGLGLLLDTFEAMVATDPTLRLLVAGRPGEFRGVEALKERCERNPRITSQFAFLPDDQLQVWLGAADLAVLPYRAVLNSGAFLLAETFGLPIVAPRLGTLAAQASRPHVRLFDPSDATSLRHHLEAALDDFVLDPEGAVAAREASLAAGRAAPPSAMAAAFTRAVAPHLRPST